MLRILSAGALALALLIAPGGGEGHAAGFPLVTGKCGCAIGGGLFTAKCARKGGVCTRAECEAACNAAMPAKTSAVDPWDTDRPQRSGHEFRAMWSDSAALAPTDVSAARRQRQAHAAPAAAAVSASDRDGRTVAAPVSPARPRPAVATRRPTRGGLIGEIMDAALAGARAGIVPQVVEHPQGCPRTQFCGCGVSLHIFGRIIDRLNLARNWLAFPRAVPAPGMVAVHPGGHHVLAIERVLGDGFVLAYDPNSGHHLTHLHVRRIPNWPVVNPKGA